MSNKVWVKQIQLKNFQKHSNLTLDFAEGVNIIHGKSDVGKSCIRRAIQWVLWNEKIDGVRKTGTKETSVTILFNSGIAVEKVRSASINRYIIHKDNQEIKFDAVNKSVPDEVKEVIGIDPIQIDDEDIYLNATPQIGLPFLFDKSPVQRMKLFNKLTGNDLLDKLFVQLNKDILGINRDLKETKASLESQVTALAEKEIEKEKLEAKYKKAKTEVTEIEKLENQYCKLLEIIKLQENCIDQLAITEEKLKNISYPQDLEIKELTDKIDNLKALITLQDALEQTQIVDRITAQLSALIVPEVNIAEEMSKIQTLDNMRQMWYTYNDNGTQVEVTAHKLKGAEKDIAEMENQFKSLLKEAKVCPVCFSEMTDKHIGEIKL